jgi:hypothetical protein
LYINDFVVVVTTIVLETETTYNPFKGERKQQVGTTTTTSIRGRRGEKNGNAARVNPSCGPMDCRINCID